MDSTALTRHDAGHQQPRRLTFEFSGDSREYFRIWIVNLCLSLLRLGIYSAWAKVRSERYFYGHTRLDDSSFEYTASPVTILKGRLLAFAVLVLYSLVSRYFPMTVLLFGLAFVFVRTQMTNLTLNHSRLDEHRFESRMKTGAMCRLLITNTLGILLSLGLLIPWAQVRMARYRADCTDVLLNGEPDRYIQVREAEQGAFGEELGEALDIEVGL
ncbi:MAG: DUF898 family protein [Oceanospirillaceae bacterium]|nr:DUF898 family protein [Oceanospirillaceae bacterium]